MRKTVRIKTLEKMWLKYLSETPSFISEIGEVIYPNVSDSILREVEQTHGFKASIIRMTKSGKSVVFIE